MKILFISGSKNFFDPHSNESERLKEMSQAAETVHAIIFTLKKEGYKTERIDDHTWIYPTNSIAPFFNILDALRIIHSQVYWKWKLRADVVISDDPFLSGWVGTISARWYKRRWVVNIYQDFWRNRNAGKNLPKKFWLLSKKYLLKRADSLCVFSSQAEKLLVAATPLKLARAKIISFSTIIDVEMLRSAEIEEDIHHRYPQYKFILLASFPLGVKKYIDLALETHELLRKRYLQAGMVILTEDSPDLKLNLKIERMGLSNWISLEKDDSNLVSYFKTANIFLNFSDLENDEERKLLIQAAAAGCPIISIDSPLAHEIIVDGENGILIKEPFAHLFLFNIIKTNETPGLREQFKLSSDKLIVNKFARDKETLKAKLIEAWAGKDAKVY